MTFDIIVGYQRCGVGRFAHSDSQSGDCDYYCVSSCIVFVFVLIGLLVLVMCAVS